MILLLLLTVISFGHGCENIREPLCQTGIPYKSTVFPNLAGHLFQGGASVAIQNLRPLIDQKCSPNIREFLCRVYMPECSSSGTPVMPSWEMCQEAYEGCATALSNLGISWSVSLNCTRFQVNSINMIKKRAQDKSVFWFGNGVTSLCSQPHATLMCKVTQRIDTPNSLASRFQGKLDVSTIDRLLEIHFTYPNGTFHACGNDFNFKGGSFQVDPLSDKTHTPWQVQDAPTITWPFSPSEYFTLLLFDVELFRIHGLVFNIRGNNITAGTEIEKYTAYTNPAKIASPLVFLLFAQNGRIQVTDNLKTQLKSDPINTITSNAHFTDLKAISWVKITPDPFAIGIINKATFLNNCPLLHTKAIRQHPEPFIPKDVQLEMSVVVSYSPTSITFTSCCKTYHYHETSFNVNSIGNMTVKTANVRSSAVPSITLIKRDLYPIARNFSNELYTLIMVDPDIPSSMPTVGDSSHPLIHWMVVNIPNGDVFDGVTVREYKGPLPPDGVHTYYFLVYKQESKIVPSVVGNFTGSKCTRCQFDINRFTRDEKLTLVGASWMLAQPDEYVRHAHVDESSKDIAAECANEPHYPSACSSNLLEEIIG